jgi:flagellar export protein FliJ
MGREFRLARVLRLKTQLRQLRQLELEAMAADLASLEREASVLATARDRVAEDEAEAAHDGTLSAPLLHLMRSHAAALADLEQRAVMRVKETHALLEAKRAELREERIEEKKLVRLGEYHQERRAAEDGRTTANMLDELAIQGHERARKEVDHGDT